jgi:hypothetical protein
LAEFVASAQHQKYVRACDGKIGSQNADTHILAFPQAPHIYVLARDIRQRPTRQLFYTARPLHLENFIALPHQNRAGVIPVARPEPRRVPRQPTLRAEPQRALLWGATKSTHSKIKKYERKI